MYGRSSPYFLPHNLYYDLRLKTFSPSIYQIFALSRITGYRLYDWLHVFGFGLENIPRLQIQLPCKQTTLLSSSLEDPNCWVRWLRDRSGRTLPPPVAPLAQFVEWTPPRRLHVLAPYDRQGFLYAKVGQQDTLAFPDLLPGSIVRVNPRFPQDAVPTTAGQESEQIFLLEHAHGLQCCRLQALGNQCIAPIGTQLPYPRIELQLPREAKIHGVVDLEIRSLAAAADMEAPREIAKPGRPAPLLAEARLSRLVRQARRKANLSFRDASALSRQIADLLGDERYFISPSSLSDYETSDAAPRHLHKVITLCLLYAVELSTFLLASGIALADAGVEPIPDPLFPKHLPPMLGNHASQEYEPETGGLLGELHRRCGEIPFFLRRALGELSGLSRPSLHDFFWIGGEPNALPTYLRHGLLVAVHRRKKRPRCDPAKPSWQQRLYMILKRDGNYLCACCEIENRTLVIHPCREYFQHSLRLRYPDDAEVVGQIATVVRKLW